MSTDAVSQKIGRLNMRQYTEISKLCRTEFFRRIKLDPILRRTIRIADANAIHLNWAIDLHVNTHGHAISILWKSD